MCLERILWAKVWLNVSIGGSVVEFSPATRGALVRLPANEVYNYYEFLKRILNTLCEWSPLTEHQTERVNLTKQIVWNK